MYVLYSQVSKYRYILNGSENDLPLRCVDVPVTALREMERVCRENGKILLLEHGKSHYDWLNNILDKNLHKHVERWGCIWNRDIEKLVKEAGLEIESISRFHFGTTYAITARPKGRHASAKTL